MTVYVSAECLYECPCVAGGGQLLGQSVQPRTQDQIGSDPSTVCDPGNCGEAREPQLVISIHLS